MYNGVQMKAADPLTLLLGLAGQKQSPDPNSGTGFENLLNLVPSTPSMNSLGVQPNQAAPDPVMDIIKNGWSGNMIPLLAPQELLAISGQGLPSVLGGSSDPGQSQMPNGTVLAGAEILPPDDINDNILYLNVKSLGDSAQMASELSHGDTETQEMTLPMRLRTVELRGGQIIADAEMQTATGKDIPVRLRLDIAGSSLRSDTAVSAEQAGSDARGHASLPRLLGELDVKMIVIEPVTLDEAPVMRPGQLSPIVNGEQSSGNVNRVPSQSSTPTIQPADNAGLSSSNSDGQKESSTLFQQLTGGGNEAATSVKPDPSQIQGMSVAQMANVGTSESSSELSSDVSQVRFYDLDLKLDQLKQNPGQRIKVQLMPPRLGKMELSIVNHRGLVTVNLTVESSQAKQAVEHNLSQLEQRLAVSGIKVDAFQLHVNQADRWNAFAHSQQQHYHGGQGNHGGRGYRQSPQNQRYPNGMLATDAGFQQELVNCLA